MCWDDPPPPPSKNNAGNNPPGGLTVGCPCGNLAVRVVHQTTGAPIKDAEVTVVGQGMKLTNDQGWAQWQDLPARAYDVSARKKAHIPDPAAQAGVVVVANATTTTELKLVPLELHMHVDNDRDGAVNDDWDQNNQWHPGAGKKGAVIRVNNDDEDSDKTTDAENALVDTAADVPDCAPLVLRKKPVGAVFPAGWKAVLSVDLPDKIRIFDKRAAGGTEIVGPTTAASFDVTDLSPDEHLLAMEGTIYPSTGFNGLITLTLKLFDAGGSELHSESAKVRVSPWIMFHHALTTTKIYVVDTADNVQFKTDLTVAVGGVPIQAAAKATFGVDRWMQDVMEPGFSSLPAPGAPANRNMPVTLRTYNDRPAMGWGPTDGYPKNVLLGPDYGFTQAATPGVGDTLDSFGNLECSPPFTHSKTNRKYPFGRIVYGGGGREMHAQVRQFLVAQKVQEPFAIDTDWLVVGHVDEAISFLPLPSARKGFKVLTASPKMALDIVRRVPASAKLFEAINLTPGTIRTVIDAACPLATAGAITADATFCGYQDAVQIKMNAIKGTLKTNLDLLDSDFIDLPVLFKEEGGRYVAYTPDVVNMLVVTASAANLRLCVPKPFGPKVAGLCQFEKKVRAQLNFKGITVTFVDDFTTYHMLYGEIHCGTNSQRTPPQDRWWWDLDWL